MKKMFTFILTLVMLQVLMCQSASLVPTQVGETVSTPAQLQRICQAPDAEAITNLPNQLTRATETIQVPNQDADTVKSVAGKYMPRTVNDVRQSTLFNKAIQANAAIAASPAMASQYTTRYATRQVATETPFEVQSSQQQMPNKTTQVSQTASALTEQTQNFDPVALSQCVLRTLEENFGRAGSLLYDLITSREGLGEDFVPIAAYAAQRLGTENIRNAVNTVLNLAGQVDWRSRMQTLFTRIGDLRDNMTGLTLQDSFQAIKNIFDNPRTFDELRQRIRDGTNQTVSATAVAANLVGDTNEGQTRRSRHLRTRSSIRY